MPQQARPHPVTPKKIHRLAVHEGQDHVHVTGHLEVEHGGAQLLVPISYRVRHDEDPARHEELLDELHEKAKHWGERRKEHCALRGHKQKVGESEVHITDCDIQMHAANDWKLVVSWNETHPGALPMRRHKVFSYHTPLQAMSAEDVKALILGEARTRATVNTGVTAHKEAMRAVHFAHSQEVARLRGAGSIRESGPAVRAGEPIGVVGGLPQDTDGKQ